MADGVNIYGANLVCLSHYSFYSVVYVYTPYWLSFCLISIRGLVF